MEDFSDLSNLQFVESSNWLPNYRFIKKEYKDRPFEPFIRMDRIGKCCDFVSNNSKYNQMILTGREDNEGFIMVESNKVKTSQQKQKPKVRNQPIVQTMGYNPHIKSRPGKKKPNTNYSRYNNRNFNRTKFVNAGSIHSDWQIVIDINMPQLDRKTMEYTMTTLASHGYVQRYNPKFEQVRAKKPYVLPRTKNSPCSVPSTFEDPFLTHMYKAKNEQDEGKACFFMADNLFLVLCTMQKNNFPWNVKLYKYQNKFILYSNSNDPSAAFINLSTYNENLQGNLPEDENELGKLCFESTLINENFLQTCTQKESTITETNEIIGSTSLIDLPVMYKYKRLELQGTNVVYTRVPVEGYEEIAGEKKLILIKTLHEVDQAKWLKDWEANKNLQLTTLYRNNTCKVLKWICQAILAEVTTLKIAFAIRSQYKDSSDHKIIAVEDVPVVELMTTFGFSFDNSLLCLNVILDNLAKLEEDGEYIINKSAFKPSFKVLKVSHLEEIDEEDDDNY